MRRRRAREHKRGKGDGYESETLSTHGANARKIIGVPGFEPGTSPTRTARATRLRYTPNRP